MRATPEEPGVKFLIRLLSRTERTPERARAASDAPDYDELTTAEMVRRFLAQMQTAERVGAVLLRYGKRERSHLIERVTVKDANALARHLGRDPSRVTAKSQRAKLDQIVVGADPWLSALLDEIELNWSKGEAYYRLGSSDIASAKEFLTLLVAISRGQCAGLDVRTFSLRATGDSKAFERHASRVAAVLGPRLGAVNYDQDVIWRRIGLERFAHPVHLKGPLRFEDKEGVLADGRAFPFLSVHPELAPLLSLRVQPSLLLTIENYASFNRYAREISDGALVVYTGGFASAAVIEILQALLDKLSETVPFFHWGDVDPGGVRIFRVLEEALSRPPQPHLMTQALSEQFGKLGVRDASLSQIAASDSQLANLARWLAFGDVVRHLEQEALDPVSPLTSSSSEATPQRLIQQ